ncbi:MAG: hypothetical protein ACXADY_26035 [Candidatus Hodarchaeales archaeon]|jgi:hypothetical protein
MKNKGRVLTDFSTILIIVLIGLICGCIQVILPNSRGYTIDVQTTLAPFATTAQGVSVKLFTFSIRKYSTFSRIKNQVVLW